MVTTLLHPAEMYQTGLSHSCNVATSSAHDSARPSDISASFHMAGNWSLLLPSPGLPFILETRFQDNAYASYLSGT